MMPCYRCQTMSPMIDSRYKDTERRRRRRYKCPDCGHRFTTSEAYGDEIRTEKRMRDALGVLMRTTEEIEQLLQQQERTPK